MVVFFSKYTFSVFLTQQHEINYMYFVSVKQNTIHNTKLIHQIEIQPWSKNKRPWSTEMNMNRFFQHTTYDFPCRSYILPNKPKHSNMRSQRRIFIAVHSKTSTTIGILYYIIRRQSEWPQQQKLFSKTTASLLYLYMNSNICLWRRNVIQTCIYIKKSWWTKKYWPSPKWIKVYLSI